jgi:hypothetical protein
MLRKFLGLYTHKVGCPSDKYQESYRARPILKAKELVIETHLKSSIMAWLGMATGSIGTHLKSSIMAWLGMATGSIGTHLKSSIMAWLGMATGSIGTHLKSSIMAWLGMATA